MKAKDSPNFKPHPLLDYLCEKFGLDSDKQLSEKTGIKRSNISRVRNGFLPLSNSNLVRIHETCKVSIKKQRELIAGDKP